MVDQDDFVTDLAAQDVSLSYDADVDRYYLGVTVRGDVQLEDHERFSLRLSSSDDNVDVAASGATVAGEIRGDDYGIQLATVSTQLFEDSGRFTFEVLRLGPTDQSMDVALQVGAPDSGTGAVASADDFANLDELGLSLVDGVLTGRLSFDEGQGTARFTLETAGDFRDEGNERFTVMASVEQVNDQPVTPTALEVSSIDCLIYDESSDMLAASNDPVLDPVIDPLLAHPPV